MTNKFFIIIFFFITINAFLNAQIRAHGSYRVMFHNKSGIYGFISKSGKMVISAKYDFAEDFSEGLALVGTNYYKRYFIDPKGDSIISCENDFIIKGSFSEGLAPVELFDGRLGYIDKNSKLILGPFNFSSICPFYEGMACVESNSRYGYINKDGKLVVEIKYFSNNRFYNGYAPVCVSTIVIKTENNGMLIYSKDVYGKINKSGEMIIKPKLIDIGNLCEGLIEIDLNHITLYNVMTGNNECIDEAKMGFIDISGNEVIKPKYYYVRAFSEGLCAVQKKKEGKFGYINKSGKMIIKPKFNDADNFIIGLAAVKFEEKWGYIDKKGKFVIPPRFDYALPFCEGLAAVCVDDKWGYIDINGNIIIKPVFLEAYYFSDGLARVKVEK